MNVRDAGLIALGFVAGWIAATSAMVAAAHDLEGVDKMIRSLRLRYGGKVEGQG